MHRSSIVVSLAALASLGGTLAYADRGADLIPEVAASLPSAPAADGREPVAAADFEPAPPPAQRGALADLPAELGQRIDSWFEGHGTRRVHVQLDRPMFRPGETVWLKSYAVSTADFAGDGGEGVLYELVDPRGTVAQRKQVQHVRGMATNDFVLPADAPGGRWTLRATLATGEVQERPFVVASYQTPRIHKELEFVREAYGPGDRVEALVELTRPDGRPLADHPVKVMMQVDGQVVHEGTARSDDTGAVLASASLPTDLSASDGLLTVLVDEGGVSESISRSLPIVLSEVDLDFFPEGGDLVQGLPARVYFAATNRHGEPADVEGIVEDDDGRIVAELSSVHDGMGRFAFTPHPGRRYQATLRLGGKLVSYRLPQALDEGCALRSYDDVHSEHEAVRVGVRCTDARDVVVAGTLREQTLDTASVHVEPNRPTVVHLDAPDALAHQQGAVRVTLFDGDLHPLAERLVYRHAGADLDIAITPKRETYGPRDEVVLDVRTTDPSGVPVAADVALSVVDDAVLGLADDEEGHMLSRLYLEPDLVDAPDDPGWYYDDEEALAARGLDLVMGTKGWRHFTWAPVFADDATVAATTSADGSADWYRQMVQQHNQQQLFGMGYLVDEVIIEEEEARPRPARRPLLGLKRAERVPMAAAAPPAVAEVADVGGEVAVGGMPAPAQAVARRDVAMARERQARGPGRDQLGAADLEALGYIAPHGSLPMAWAPVRAFPAPAHAGTFDGVRTDFRDTVHWAPNVTTGDDGRAEVRFVLSDALTTFRVTAEGLGGSYAGHGEATLASTLPVGLDVKLPPAVSAGDRLVMPVVVSNTRSGDLTAQVGATVDEALRPLAATEAQLPLASGHTDTVWMPFEVTGGPGQAEVRLAAEGGGLRDELVRSMTIEPVGFPRQWTASGRLGARSTHTVTLGDVVEGSLTATLTLHPSPVSTLISGMEGLIRTPGGCFEQTSSTNWPNVAILNYLEAHDSDPRLKLQSAKALEAGYAKLTGYQVDAGGFETWGTGPGKEALSAFGLLQFADMQAVYPVADEVLDDDVDYLLAQRDGDGGFRNTGSSAHGYGSAPADVLNGFITWALVKTGHADELGDEVAEQARVARDTDDAYVLALAARTLVATDHRDADRAVARLSRMQHDDGSFPDAASSITRSHEANLVVESTSLAMLALMEAGADQGAIDQAADWLVKNRRGATWGATQATALALEALTSHARVSARPPSDGTVWVEVDGEKVAQLDYFADQAEPLELTGWEDVLHAGTNEVVLRHEGGEALPFTLDLQWTATTPATAPGAELSLATELSDEAVGMGQTVRLTATVGNRTERVVPSPIARIRLPAGLQPQTWQLEQLQDRGRIAFFETRPREVTLYWDGLHAGDAHEVALDLVAQWPGAFTGPASSAYPYYNDDEKAWAGGLQVAVHTPQR